MPRVLPTSPSATRYILERQARVPPVQRDRRCDRVAVLYLPAEKLLVTGDVLVSPEDGQGPPPWTTNSYAITPWLASLRALRGLDRMIVPGRGRRCTTRRTWG